VTALARPGGGAHVVIDARSLGWSTGRYVERLLPHLELLDQVNRYTVLVHPADARRFRPCSPNFVVKLTNIPGYSVAEQIRLARVLRRLQPDLVHFCMPQQPLLYRGTKITTVHDLTLLRVASPRHAQLTYRVRQLLFRGVLGRAVRSSAALLVPSECTRRDVESHWPRRHAAITVTPEAADVLLGEPRPFPLPHSDFLLYVGQQKDYKNVRRLAAAHQALLERHPDLGLVLVGRIGRAEQDNLNFFHESGYRNIVMPGFVPDDQLSWLYRNCRVYVFASLMEGFGLPGLEAMAHGAPVASSDRTSLPEVYGDAAAYFNPEDVAEMAATLGEVLDDDELRCRLIKAGAERVRTFSWRRTAEQTLATYDAVLMGGDRRDGTRG
jgi:glycosyltransferase involved in cell wall biosynthesis